MAKLLVFLMVAVLTILVACGGGGSERQEDEVLAPDFGVADDGGGRLAKPGAPTPAPLAAAAIAIPTALDVARGGQSSSFAFEAPVVRPAPDLHSLASNLEIAQRKVISVASISIEVELVESAVTEVRVIAEGLGGFVEQLSSSGGPEHQTANITLRVPQGQFFTALDRIEAIGEVRDRRVGSEDVSEQFIDLEARLKSFLREEQSLLSLLERTETVSEILTIERELSRVRSQIERLQGQLNYLGRRVELATIGVTLFPPKMEGGEPPFGTLTVEVGDVSDSVAVAKKLVLGLKGSLDNVFLSVNDGDERAELSLLVFASDFERTLNTLAGQGKVRSVEIREGTSPTDGDAAGSEDPDAHINLSLVGTTGSSNTGLIVSIAAPTGGVATASLLGFLFYLSYRERRRRAVQA